MKNYIASGLALAALITSGTVAAYDLKDNYIGGSDPRDVIGGLADYDTLGLNASLVGSILTVDIFANFAGKAEYGYGQYQTQTAASGWGKGIAYGDLFFSSAGNTNNDWEYGFSIDDRWAATGGSADLYSLKGPDAFLSSDDFISTGDYRHGQNVAVNTSSKFADKIGTGNWSVNEYSQIISFAVDVSGTGLVPGSDITFGWAMTCANDMIKGTVKNVPEPGALGLIGLGLIGTIIGRRRQKIA